MLHRAFPRDFSREIRAQSGTRLHRAILMILIMRYARKVKLAFIVSIILREVICRVFRAVRREEGSYSLSVV